MGTLGNLIWFIFGGFFEALIYFIEGIIFCITIIGIPLGRQCFKMAKLTIWPFGKEVIHGGGTVSFFANVLWFLFCGLWMAILYSLLGLVFCVTIIGIPFGKQCFKLAGLTLRPFGAEVI